MPRGRKPKPPKLRVVDGNPGKRPARHSPEAPTGCPACPSWLASAAKTEWKRVSPLLLKAGTLATTDLAVLACYCQTWADWQAAVKVVIKSGQTYGAGDLVKRHPAVGIADAAAKQLRLLASELGLTALSRMRLDVGAEPERDELEDYLREQRG